MTDQNPDPNATPEATESPVAPTAPDAPPTPPAAPAPAPEPAIEAPEAPEPAAGDQELDFDDADAEFAAFAAHLADHPSKQPVASRPAPAGPYSHPHERVARARDENR
jgi:hypothetical protein